MVYYLQEILMITGLIAQSILVVLMVLSIYTFFQINIFYRTGIYLKWLNVMLLVVTIYGIVLFLSGYALYPDEFNLNTSLQFGYLQNIYSSVLPIYAFYYFTLKGGLSEDNMKNIFFAFLLFSIIMYYQNFFVVSEEIEKEEITNNMGYRFVPLIPMLALFKMKEAWKYVVLLIVFTFLIMSMKRGAILVGTIALLLYAKHFFKAYSTKHIFYLLFLSTIAICFILLFVVNLYETSDLFKGRFSSTMEGDTSNRLWIYTHYYDFFIHRTTNMEFLFGCGANAAYLRFGQYSHNDWLEFAINQGVFGVVLYLIYWILFCREWINFQGSSNTRHVLGILIVVYFLKSWFSMSFDGMFIAATLCIGYCLAQNAKASLSIKRIVNRK